MKKSGKKDRVFNSVNVILVAFLFVELIFIIKPNFDGRAVKLGEDLTKTLSCTPYQENCEINEELSETMTQEDSVFGMGQTSCVNEYCEPNPLFTSFFDWMRERSYGECVAGFYLNISQDSNGYGKMLQFITKRPSNITQPFIINFYDIIPTDPEATYLSLGEGEGGSCRPSSSYPNFCPSPIPADYKFLENHFKRTFGIDIRFVYNRTEIDYSENMGDPELIGNLYRFPRWTSYVQRFPKRSIVHFAIQTWNDKYVYDMTGSIGPAAVSLEPFNFLGAVTYTHEFGHTLRLPHSFGGDPRVFYQLDGIMGNTYGGFSRLTDPTDPLERYVLEPLDGFKDDKEFAIAYTEGVIGINPLENFRNMTQCLDTDLSFGNIARLVKDDELTFHIEMRNLGKASSAHVRLSTINDAGENLAEERIIEKIGSDGITSHNLTLDIYNLNPTSRTYLILDRGNKINETDETNNNLQIFSFCGDADGSGDINEADVDFLSNYVLEGGQYPRANMDLNGDHILDILDVVLLVNHVYRGYAPPTCKFFDISIEEVSMNLSSEQALVISKTIKNNGYFGGYILGERGYDCYFSYNNSFCNNFNKNISQLYLGPKQKTILTEQISVSYPNISSLTVWRTYYGISENNETEKFLSNNEKTVNFVMPPLYGKIYASTNPSSAYFYVDNVYKGLTPILINVTSGSHNIKFTKSGYNNYFQTIYVNPGQTLNISVNLTISNITNTTNRGSIYGNTIPSGANMSVDNIFRGLTPWLVANLTNGTHSVKFVKAGYQTYLGNYSVYANQTTNVTVYLNATNSSSGSLTILA